MEGKESYARPARAFQWNVRRQVSFLSGRLSGICYPVYLWNTAYVILSNTYVNFRSVGDVLCLGRQRSKIGAEEPLYHRTHDKSNAVKK